MIGPRVCRAGTCLPGLVMEVPAAREGTPSGAIRFSLVLLGKIDA